MIPENAPFFFNALQLYYFRVEPHGVACAAYIAHSFSSGTHGTKEGRANIVKSKKPGLSVFDFRTLRLRPIMAAAPPRLLT